jgi:formylmethanofuran dehydrogenase subunit E
MSEKIRSFSFDEYVAAVQKFHSYAAPGVLIGGFIVELAYRHLPKEGMFDIICETDKCLPDAATLLTPCTIGNGWLKIMNNGKFALIIYDKVTGDGIRVFVDTQKLDKWPEIKNWFLNLKPKKEQDSVLLQNQIRDAGTSILSFQTVKVDLTKIKPKHTDGYGICPNCKESYNIKDGGLCLACQGKMPYQVTNDR